MAFQDELRNNMKTKEEVDQLAAERITSKAQFEADQLMRDIKASLLKKVKEADYFTRDGVTTVCCSCPLPQRYIAKLSRNNNHLLIQNNRKGIFKKRNAVYQSWYVCELTPIYENEYKQLVDILTAKAHAENISVKFIVFEKKENKAYDFPGIVDGFHFECDLILSVEAKTTITQ